MKPNFGKIILVSVNSQYILHQCLLLCFSEVDMLPAYGPYPPQTIEIINNTRGDIAILTSGKKRNAAIGGGGGGGAISSPGCVFMFPLVSSFKSANESIILYLGLEFPPPPINSVPIF